VIGAAVWVATWVTIGDVAGDHIDTIYADINRYSLYVFGAIVALAAGYIAWRVIRRRGRSGSGPAGASSPARENSEAQGS
jgi:membrane protein DedA with SNARE-associated domain